MIKSSIELLAESIGFDIANSDDETQANLLNGLCKGIRNSMDKQKREMQLCYITNRLSNESCEILKELVEFIKLKEQI